MQLVMTRESLADLPPVVLPAGYGLRHFRSGEEGDWERILNESFGEVQPPRRFVKVMAGDAACCPERILFATWEDVPVATASAWYNPATGGADTGYVHYVGVCAGHRGKKLGYWVSLAVLHRFVFEGRSRSVLLTDDPRVPAIKTYLALGFEPWLVEENQRQRWRAIIESNRFQALCPKLEKIVTGPIHPGHKKEGA